MSATDEQIADAYNEGYDEARTSCQQCIAEFQSGIQLGLTIARAKILECETLAQLDLVLQEALADARGES